MSFAVLMFALSAFLLVICFFYWQAGSREVEESQRVAPKTGRWTTAGDVEIYVQEEGPIYSTPVIFVHGTGAWSETWRDTMRALATAGFRSIAIDLPPFGYSKRPTNSRYDKNTQGARIVAVLDGLNIDRAILVGHSFGGGPTVEAAFLSPTRIQGLVLVDAALSIREVGEPPAQTPQLIEAFFAATSLRDGVVATFLTNPMFTRKLLEKFIADPGHATVARVAVYQQPLVVKGTTHAFDEWLPYLLVPSPDAKSEDPLAYRSLSMPTYILWGDSDTITPLNQGQRLAKLIPDSELVVLQSTGHIPQIENLNQFNQVLLRFLIKTRGAR